MPSKIEDGRFRSTTCRRKCQILKTAQCRGSKTEMAGWVLLILKERSLRIIILEKKTGPISRQLK